MEKYEVGEIALAVVTGIENYGIFVELDDNYTGLIHISEISNKFVANINDYVEIGERINVQIIEKDEKNKKLKLSIKNLNYRIRKKQTQIKETEKGFTTLKNNLPIWVDKKIEEIKN